jgi:hypothetical protein
MGEFRLSASQDLPSVGVIFMGTKPVRRVADLEHRRSDWCVRQGFIISEVLRVRSQHM